MKEEIQKRRWHIDGNSMVKYGIFTGAIVPICADWWFVGSYFVLDRDILN